MEASSRRCAWPYAFPPVWLRSSGRHRLLTIEKPLTIPRTTPITVLHEELNTDPHGSSLSPATSRPLRMSRSRTLLGLIPAPRLYPRAHVCIVHKCILEYDISPIYLLFRYTQVYLARGHDMSSKRVFDQQTKPVVSFHLAKISAVQLYSINSPGRLQHCA